jgi:hypothetical protein
VGGFPQTQGLIANNLIDGVPAWDGIGTHECTDLVIENNVIRNVRIGIDVGHAVAANVDIRFVIQGNSISSTTANNWGASAATSFGIGVAGFDATNRCTSVVIANNLITGWGGIAGTTYGGFNGSIVLAQADFVTIRGNLITGMLGTSANLNAMSLNGTLNDVIIEGNVIQGTYNAGIRANAITCNDSLLICGNVFDPITPATMAGILITASTITNKIVYGNADLATTAAGSTDAFNPSFGNVFVLTDAATIAIDASRSNAMKVTLAGNRAMGAPTNPQNGQRIHFTIVQDGTGGRTLTWNAVFKATWADTGNTLGRRSTIAFIYDGTNWNQDGAQSPYVT